MVDSFGNAYSPLCLVKVNEMLRRFTMSFSELNYKHQVIVFDLKEQGINNLKSVEIPVSAALKRVPLVRSSLTEVISALQQLPAAGRGFSGNGLFYA